MATNQSRLDAHSSLKLDQMQSTWRLTAQPVTPRIMEPSFRLFEEKPMGDPATRVIVQIGRVLHSAPRQPSAYECLNSCHNKQLYDSLKPIEIELGCP